MPVELRAPIRGAADTILQLVEILVHGGEDLVHRERGVTDVDQAYDGRKRAHTHERRG